jgi:hypothetical protein
MRTDYPTWQITIPLSQIITEIVKRYAGALMPELKRVPLAEVRGKEIGVPGD